MFHRLFYEFLYSVSVFIIVTLCDLRNSNFWRSFKLSFLSFQSVTLTVGQWCDAELAVKFGERIGNYTCAKKVTQVLEDK